MPPVDGDIFFSTITEINQRWKRGDFSAVELVRAFSDRLEKIGPSLNALALPLREDARGAAAAVDKERKRERFRSPLQAVPYAVKDLLSVAGKPTTWGARPFAGQVFSEDAVVVQKLNKARAILIGKLAMIELAGGGNYRYPSASMTGPCLNPWDRTRWAGGSSSGSGAAVAAGLVPYALGSETSGSILTPAAFCGVTGLRPTYGLVSRKGAMPLSWTLDKIGPLARSVEDCALVLDAISGGGDAGRAFHFAPQFVRPLAELRAGFIPAHFEELAVPEIRPALQAALDVCRQMGLQLVSTTLPDFPYSALTGTIIGAEASSIFEDLIESGQVDQLDDTAQAAGLRAALDIPARDYLRAMRLRSLLQTKFREWFTGFDILITPTRFNVAPPIKQPLDTPGPAHDLIPGGNLAGLPALALPCGFAGALPVSLCLLGRPYTENMLLAAGVEFQRRTDFHRRRPAIS